VSDGAEGRVTTEAGAPRGVETGAGTPTTPTAPFFPCFDGLRALGVMSVVAAHVGFVTGVTAQKSWGDYLAHPDLAPALFFFISGFLLYRVYVAGNFAGRDPMATGAFWWRRLLRVVPAYWLALTVLIVGFGLHVSGLHDIVIYYGLLQIYDTHRFLGAIPQAWTLCTELSFYAFLPAYAWLLRRLGDGRDDATRLALEVSGAAALMVACYLYRAAIFTLYGRTSVGRIATHWLPGYLDVFGLGIALAAVSAYVAVHGTTPLVDVISRLSWLWWAMAIVCFWLVVKHLGLSRSPQPRNTPIGWQADELQLLQTAFAGLISLPAIFGPQDRGLIRRFLQWRPVAYVGLVSYGVYLYHEGFLDKWLVWTGRPNVLQLSAQVRLARSTFPLILLLTVLSSIAAASLSAYLVERPLLRLKHRVPRLLATGRGAAA
jgi:peptidoglycan/LPS O-acetylase OafA/YrhL